MGVSRVVCSSQYSSASVSCELVGRSGGQMWFPVTPGRALAEKLCGTIATHCVTLILFQRRASQSSRLST